MCTKLATSETVLKVWLVFCAQIVHKLQLASHLPVNADTNKTGYSLPHTSSSLDEVNIQNVLSYIHAYIHACMYVFLLGNEEEEKISIIRK